MLHALYTSDMPCNHSLPSPAKYYLDNALLGWIIGASLSEPLLDELAGAFLWYIYIYIYKTRTKNHFNKMKKEVGMLLQKRTDTSAVGIYKLYEENTH